MQAVRIHPADSGSKGPFSASNPAPSSALNLDTIAIPTLSKPDQLLIRVHATTVTRDELTWPETYGPDLPLLGHDLAGTVVDVQSQSGPDETTGRKFKAGDEVYAMLDMNRGSTWAEYAIARTEHVALKPKSISWAESVAVPVSALTAWQALFDKAGVTPPEFDSFVEQQSRTKGGKDLRRIAVTGANGAVGTFIVQLAALAGLHVVAIASSKSRHEEFLRSLGAKGVLEYEEIGQLQDQCDIVIDAVGGNILEQCWSIVKDDGTLISIESASSKFVSTHRQQLFTKGKDAVRALFFIVEPSGKKLEELAKTIDLGLLKVFVAQELPLQDAKTAYGLANGRLQSRGKVVLTL